MSIPNSHDSYDSPSMMTVFAVTVSADGKSQKKENKDGRNK